MARYFALGVAAWLSSVSAAPSILPPAGADGWQPLHFPRIDTLTEYSEAEIDGVDGVVAESRCSASALVFPLAGVELATTPVLRWQWRVDESSVSQAHEGKAGDDFPARVYVTFEFQPEKASGWERFRRRAMRAVYGTVLPGNALSYVWCPHKSKGELWDNPHTAATQMISLGGASLGVWRDAEVDVLADYKRAFGEAPPPAVFVALMTDTDNGCSHARAAYADFRFVPRVTVPPPER